MHGRKYTIVRNNEKQDIYIQGYHSFEAVKTGQCDDLLAKVPGVYSISSLGGGYKQATDLSFFTHESLHGSSAKAAILAFMDEHGAKCAAYNGIYDEVAVIDKDANLQIQEDVSFVLGDANLQI